ncbi:AI-2E family transporter [Natrinema salsiterrestre]|uniref:AI-2E family transporter n=1 Tax=Natrinema salsiterrestre TaxID=2950540 RepID=A0A9Q4Q0K0_9EURY|nr:AI-2E family transporter [Natrinema salsiterrestre]MDF9744331.1 AI-2E family transporter [Natrinema salsiterrestre]
MSVFDSWDGKRVAWVVLGGVLAVLIGLALFRYIGSFLFAIFLYYATRPLYRQLDRVVDHPNVTATATILFVILPMLAVVAYAVVVALRELDQFLAASDLEAYRSLFQPYLRLVREGNIDRLRDAIASGSGGSVTSVLRQGVPGVVGRLQSVLAITASILAKFFLMVTILFYLLRDDQKLRRWFYESIDRDDDIVSYTQAVDDDLETIFLSNLAVIVVAASAAAVVYYGLNAVASDGPVVWTPALLSLLIGIGTLIPAVGMKIVYVPYGLVLLGVALTTPKPLWHPIAFFAITLVVIDTIPDFFARAFLSSRSGIHMGAVLLGYFLGTLAFGWWGLFLGPIVVVLAIRFGETVFPGLASDFLRE